MSHLASSAGHHSCVVTATEAVVSDTKELLYELARRWRVAKLGRIKMSVPSCLSIAYYVDRYIPGIFHTCVNPCNDKPSGKPTTDHQMTAPGVSDTSPATCFCTCPVRHCRKNRDYSTLTYCHVTSWNAWLGRTTAGLRGTASTYHARIVCP